MKVNRQWHDPQLLQPVNGEHVILWMKEPLHCFGFGDVASTDRHLATGVYFEDYGKFLELHPLDDFNNRSIGGHLVPFFYLDFGAPHALEAVDNWHPALPQPGREIPEGEVECNGCGSRMRRVPKSDGKFKCTRCPRVIEVAFKVVSE